MGFSALASFHSPTPAPSVFATAAPAGASVPPRSCFCSINTSGRLFSPKISTPAPWEKTHGLCGTHGRWEEGGGRDGSCCRPAMRGVFDSSITAAAAARALLSFLSPPAPISTCVSFSLPPMRRYFLVCCCPLPRRLSF